jgi:multidrug efflux pump
MIYLPTMLILTLAASLIVAFIFNPVFAVSFMKPEGKQYEKPKRSLFQKWWFWTAIAFGVLLHLIGWHGLANFSFFLALISMFNVFVLKDVIYKFQNRVLPWLMSRYETLLKLGFKRQEASMVASCLICSIPYICWYDNA